MAFSLYECMTAAGLQHHYARFTSVGVCHAAQLSVLTMEDYPLLGVHTMEDRTRLFHLVQLAKTLDLENLGCDVVDAEDNSDYNVDVGDADFAADSSFNHVYCGKLDEDVSDDEYENGAGLSKNVTTYARPSGVRRRLDFSNESTDYHRKECACPVGTFHVHVSCNRIDEPARGNGSAIPVKPDLDNGCTIACGCQVNHNHKVDVCSLPSNRDRGENIKPGITGEIFMYNSDTHLSSKYESFHEPTPSPASNTFTNKLCGHKHRRATSRTQHFYTEMDGTFGNMAKPTPVYEAKRAAGYNYGLPLSSPPAASKTNKKPMGEQRISVCVRKRPLTRSESRRGEADVVTTPGGECVIVHESKEAVDLTQYILQVEKIKTNLSEGGFLLRLIYCSVILFCLLALSSLQHKFYFDQVFEEESSNEEVYQRTAYPLVQHMLSGGKATCFAYGQTGAGKTYTMLGSSPGRPGLYAMAARDIFNHLSTTNAYSSLRVHVSFFEIYCGQLYDLLDHRKRLFAREDRQKVVHISGLRDVRVDSVHSLLEVISKGTEERTQGTSGVNPLSSRSHALLQIQLREPNQRIAGRIWFVDLAGSERASDTKEPDKQSRMEGAEINQSLLALKECIRSLDREQSHTPFRQSKLTQVLKDSFVGDSMTCMIANISPGHTAAEHTLNTLRYADRVKELRGQGGLKGRRGKTVPSPKHNQSKNSSSSTSSVSTRGKSPPKKPKLGRQSEAFGPATPTRQSRVEDVILCSTPKNNKHKKEPSAGTRKGIGLENITPVRGWLAMGDKRHEGGRGADERESSRIKNVSIGNHSANAQSSRAGMVQGQPIDEQPPPWVQLKEGVADEGNLSLTERELRFCHSEKEKEQQQGGRVEEGKKWIELRRQVERSKVGSPRETGSQKADERERERERHLKRYHEQLQQFMASSTSSHLFSPSTCPSTDSSAKGSLPYPDSPSSLQHPSHLSVSSHMHRGLEEILDAYAARVEVRVDAKRGHSPSGEIHSQTETSTVCSHSNDDGDRDGVHEGLRVSWEGVEAGIGQNRCKTEKKRSVEATGEASIRKEDMKPSAVEEAKRRCAWVATTEREASDKTAGAIPTHAEERFSYSCDSDDRRELGVEELNASDVGADGVWSAEQGGAADSYINDDSNSLFSHPPFESPSQRAPAERPLSPAWERANAFLTPAEYSKYNTNILPVPLRNTSEVGPSNRRRQKQPWFGVNSSKTQISHAQSTTSPLTTAIMHSGSKTAADTLKLSENPAYSQVRSQPDVKAKMSPGETYSDSLGHIMDPLTISLLQVDQKAATASFLQGDNTSLCLLQDQNGEDNRRRVNKNSLPCVKIVGKVTESEDITFYLSHLELPQAATQHATTSETVRATNQTEQRKDVQLKICGKGRNKPLTAEVILENNQKPETTPNLGNKASTLKPSTSAAMPTSFMSPSVQHHGNMSSPSLHNPVSNATQIVYAPNEHKSSCVTTPQSESVSGHFNTMQSQCHTGHSKHSSNSHMSLQRNNPAQLNGQGSTSNQQIRPTVHLFTGDDLEEAKWCIVEAHLEQLKEMETLCHKEGKLLCQQPDMAFGEYINRLEEIMERKAQSVRNMRAQLQPYLKPTHSNHLHPQ
ncbi:uncharacterized protein LOC125012723 isoform X2 [Mugil cephalus]|nr:uncharacterized protein LOC125012723 isoform X2 [Mugil cephalus]